ncbi:MAG: hypothetical protein ACI8UO_001909 [Verrucomicrobiales bacterium]|jgi:hypothetical protein
MNLRWLSFHTLFLLLLIAFVGPAAAADDKKEDENKKEDEKKVHPVTKAKNALREKFQEIRKASEKQEGLFELYQDKRDGKVYLAIKPGQLDREFIHFAYTNNGIVAASHFRGYFEDAKIFTLRKRFDEIDFVVENHSFYYDPDNALSRASNANVSPAVVATAKIVAEEHTTKTMLIEADGVFLKEIFRQIKPSEKKGSSSDKWKIGTLSGERTRFVSLENYSKNTALTVDYVFENLHPGAWPEEADVTDARFVSIEVQHTLIELEDSTYQPRFDDPRVGYFMTQVTDMTSKSNTPYRDLIHRWHLEAKDPNAKGLLEPKQPIVWWIENSTPVELRETIREAVLGWNVAFETAGWKNAVECKIQPDDADWDAGDIRYNVLRWSSSPDVPFGGYGPSFVNPRTGQIIAADIQLEYKFLTNRVRYRKIFQEPGDEGFDPFQRARAKFTCAFNDHLHQNNLFGRVALKMSGLGPFEMDDLMKQALTALILHEVGHTLGLGHNFIASTFHDSKAIHDKAATEVGLTASVMDYSPINAAAVDGEQGLWYDNKPGPYDHWAIDFGYSRAATDVEAETTRLDTILVRSTEPGLAYANDADDMRSAGKAIDPRAMIGDMSADPLAYAAQRLDLSRKLLQQLLEKSPEDGRSFQTITDHRSTLIYSYRSQLDVISRQIGGVHIDRAIVGQKGGTQPLTPVELKTQQQAMTMLNKYAFAPDAFGLDPKLLAHLQTQRRGWDFESAGEDPKILAEILGAQNSVLNHVLHQNTVTRILNTELYGNQFSLTDVFGSLTESIFAVGAEFEADPGVIRQGLQRSYVDRLIKIAGLQAASSYPQAAQAGAFYQIEALEAKLSQSQNAHLRHLAWVMRKALNIEGK